MEWQGFNPYGYTIPRPVTKNEKKVGRGLWNIDSFSCEIDSDILQEWLAN
jgi:hypothetical protein